MDFSFNKKRPFGFNGAGQRGATVSRYAAWPNLIGPNLITNPGCGSDVGWNEGAGVTVNVVPGKMVMTTASSNTTNDGAPTGAFVEGIYYRIDMTIETVSLGSVQAFIGTAAGTSRSTAATFSQDILAAGLGSGGWKLTGTSASMQLDDFSVKSVGGMGVASDWVFGGGVEMQSDGSVLFTDNPADTASLTGAAAAAFDAGVSNNTPCTVTVYGGTVGSGMGGSVEVSLKDGLSVNFAFTEAGAAEPVTHTVISGSGSGFSMDSGGVAAFGPIVLVQVGLA